MNTPPKPLPSHWTDKIYANFHDSVFRLMERNGLGNAFIVYKKDLVTLLMTACHCINNNIIDGQKEVMIAPCGLDISYVATIVYYDHIRDVALLRVENVEFPGRALSFCDTPPEKDMMVVLLGFLTIAPSTQSSSSSSSGSSSIVGKSSSSSSSEKFNVCVPGTSCGVVEIVHQRLMTHDKASDMVDCFCSTYVSKRGMSGGPVFLVGPKYEELQILGIHVGGPLPNEKLSNKLRIAHPVLTIKKVMKKWLNIKHGDPSIDDMLEIIAKEETIPAP